MGGIGRVQNAISINALAVAVPHGIRRLTDTSNVLSAL
jgi:hypothetical protein